MSDTPSNPHDRFFRTAFAWPQVAEGFLRAYLPVELATAIRLDALHLHKDTFIEKALRDFRSDLLYETTWRNSGKPVLLYLLFEHKSTPDRWAGLQLLGYIHQIWTAWLKQPQDTPKTRFLPTVLPLVVYHGRDAWGSSPRFGDLQLPRDVGLTAYQLKFEYLLCDLSDLSARELKANLTARLAMRALYHIFAENSREGLKQTLSVWAEIVDKKTVTELLETVLRYFVRVHPELDEPVIREALTYTGDQRLMENFIDAYIRQGREEGLQQGVQQGLQQGEQVLLRRLLTRRFGTLPAWAEQRLETAPPHNLEDWGEKLLEAESLEAVFH